MDRKRILVIRGGAVGDFILTLPAIRMLRKGFPECELEIVGYRHIAALAEGRFYADRVRSIEYSAMAGFFNPRSNLDPELSAYFAGFGQVISYLFDPDGFFEGNLRRCGVEHLVVADPRVAPGEHAAAQLARPLEALGLFLDDPTARFFPSADDRAAAQAHMAASDAFPLVAHPGSGSVLKSWPIASWIDLLRCLAQRPEPVFVVGGESDAGRLAALRASLPSNVRFLEGLPLCTLGAILARARLFIGHDSGISHLAAAAGAKCLLLFGPTDPKVWAPANADVHVLTARNGKLEDLSVIEVENRMLELLK